MLCGIPRRLLLLIPVVSLLATTPSLGAPGPFDGNWMVRVTGETGECRVAYSLAFEVAAGRVAYVGKNRATAEGTVGTNGQLAITISQGDDVVLASGALNHHAGAGTWTSRDADCGGIWKAQKYE